MSADESRARRFLVGEMDDAEREGFELALLEDPALHELVAAVDDELLADYADGAAPAGYRARIDDRLAHDSALRARLELARALSRRANRRGPRRRSIGVWLAVGAVGAAAGALLLVRAASSVRGSSVEVAVAGATRGGDVVEVAVTRGTAEVRLRLGAVDVSEAVVEVRGPSGPVPATLVIRAGGPVIVLDPRRLAAGLYDVRVRGPRVDLDMQVRVRRDT